MEFNVQRMRLMLLSPYALGYEKVLEAFDQNFQQGLELGSSFVAYVCCTIQLLLRIMMPYLATALY